MKEREREGELVIVGSDKSGKRAVMTKQLCKDLMELHLRGDSSHEREEIETIEKQFNGAHTASQSDYLVSLSVGICSNKSKAKAMSLHPS